MKAKIDYAFLSLLGTLLIISVITASTSEYILNVTNYLGIIAWSLVLVIRIIKPRLGRYFVACLILLTTLNFISFELIKTSTSIGFGSFSTPSVNPGALLLLFVYYLINQESINNKIKHTFNGSAEEQEIKHHKMVSFYTDKFKDLDKTEFDEIFKNINTYPDEAQIALKQLLSKYSQQP